MFLSFVCLVANSQNDSIVATRAICADLDMKGNVYYIDSSYELCKQTKGVTTNRFSLTNYGEGPVIDASNPLEVFVFYENSGILLIMDNNLNPVQEVNLYSANNIRVQGFGRANDGKIWVFDANSYTLKKYDRIGTLVTESVMLNKGSEQKTKGINKIFDNGALVAFQQGQQNTLVLNNNLKVLFNKANNSRLVGLEGNAILEQDKNTLNKRDITTTNKQTKTMLSSSINGEIVCAIQGRMLMLNKHTLKLKTY